MKEVKCLILIYFKENSLIDYFLDYNKEITHYQCDKGRASLLYTNYDLIKMQRDCLGWFIKELGTNISKLNNLAKLNLPLNLYDHRTIMEIFSFQHVLAPLLLNKVIDEDFSLEKLKIVSIILKL